MSDTAIVKALARDIRRAMRKGPRAMRFPGSRGRYGVGMGRNTFTPGNAYFLLVTEDAQTPIMWTGPSPRSAWSRANQLFRRAMKKAGQPHRKNHQRKRMQAKAAGKNNVTNGGSNGG